MPGLRGPGRPGRRRVRRPGRLGRTPHPGPGPGGRREPISAIRTEMQRAVEEGAGIYRSADSLAKAADKLRELRERYAAAQIEDHSRTFNTELIAALELSCMLDVAETIVRCAQLREESRGAHQRIDFPARDDERFLANSLIYRSADGGSRVEYLP